MSDDSLVSAVIPVRNRLGHTLACLESLVAQSYSRMTVIIVDDGSTDGTASVVRDQYPETVLLQGDGDLWWSGATNLGVEWALRRCSPDDYVLTLNNDTTVGPEYVATLVRLARLTEPSLVGSVAVDSRDEKTIVDGGPKVAWLSAKWWSMNQGRSLQDCLSQGTRFAEVSCLPGRGTLIPVRCLHEIGLFDAQQLPHYAADYEFAIRAARAGYRLLMSYEAPVMTDITATGISSRGQLRWKELGPLFFSRRSPSCLMYRWRFALMAAPKKVLPAYVAADTGRVIAGVLRDQLRGVPL